MLGRSIPSADRRQLAQEFRKTLQRGAIISLRRGSVDELVQEADLLHGSGSERLLQLISRIAQSKGQSAE
ncbi:MAG TPA: hypothetical protein VFA89_20810 [Terriglobales bacterium]|nr:hypothetical protein [Terriglobales bacterium]